MLKFVEILIGFAITGSCFSPPEISFSQLRSSSASYVLSTLSQTGMLAITDIPEFEATRQWALSSVQECLSNEKKNGVKGTLLDGTLRHTLMLKGDYLSDCPEIQQQLGLLRDIVQKTVDSVAMVLDESPINLHIKMKNGNTLTTMSEVVHQAKHLDHFHLYEGNSTADSVAMDIHLDAGIFIAFVPPLWKEPRNAHDSGLLVELPSGKIESVILNENTVVIMVGLGAQRFLQLPLRPVPHALHVPRGEMRSWYGRMILLPEDMLLDEEISFRDFWLNANEEIVSGMGCSPTSKDVLGPNFNGLMDQVDPPCPTNTTDCWTMSPGNICIPDISCPVNVTSICWNDNSPMGPHMCVSMDDCLLKCNKNTSWI